LHAAQQLKAVAPQDPRASVELASALNNLGTLAEGRNQFSKALGYFKQSAAIRESQISGPTDRVKLDLANSLSWISRIHNNLGEPAQAWYALERAVLLVSELRLHADDNQLRQRETTLRYMLGMNSLYRGDAQRTRHELAQALALARLDVENDPSQPRRHAMLARISFEWVRASENADPAAKAILDEGLQALAKLPEHALSSTETLGLQTRACMAQLVIDASAASVSDCELRIWPKLMQSAIDEADMIELAGELTVALAKNRPDSVTKAQIRAIADRLKNLPAQLRASMSHLLVLRSLGEQIDSSSIESSKMSEQIDRMRASFNHQPGV